MQIGARSQTDGRSTSGYMFTLGSAAISWDARNKLLFHDQVLKLNIEELQWLLLKKYGLEDCLLIWDSI